MVLMTKKAIGALIVGGMMVLAQQASAGAGQELPGEDKRIIDAVLEGLKGRKDLKFVREKKVYDAKTAAWYMKYKWEQNRDKVKSVADFVALQSVGGKNGEITYYVEYADGTRKTAKDVLEEAVKQLRGGSQAKN